MSEDRGDNAAGPARQRRCRERDGARWDRARPAGRWDYTFDHLTEIVEGALTAIGFTGPMGIYMQDYGGPIGNRIIAKHPDWLQLKWQSCGCKQGGRELVQP